MTEQGNKRAGKSIGKPSSRNNTVSFEFFAPEARQVYLAGSFNEWLPDSTALKKDRQGRWKVELKLAPGRYEYRYLVDGSWQNDQRPVSYTKNPFGESNCVIEVPNKKKTTL